MCYPVPMHPSVLLSTFVQMINHHNKAFHKVMIQQEKDKCKHYTDKHREEKHLDVHGCFLLREFGNLGILTVGQG